MVSEVIAENSLSIKMCMKALKKVLNLEFASDLKHLIMTFFVLFVILH